MRVKMTAIALGVAMLVVWLPASANADTIKVPPGESIQAAVDQAQAGDTIKLSKGTYHESVTIDAKHDGLTIKGEGAEETVIKPPAPPPDPCTGPQNGIEALGEIDAQNNVVDPVEDLTVTGLAIDGFKCALGGIALIGAKGAEINRVVATDDGEYGIVAFNSTKGDYAHNEAAGNDEAGLYVGDSPDADTNVRHNVSHQNGFGILIRDASNGEVAHNKVYGNCVGIFFLETGAPVKNSGWAARKNLVLKNNKACPAGEGPPFSGIGILVGGVSDILVKKNWVLENRPSGPSPLGSGGIVLLSTTQLGGGDVLGARIVRNKAFGNEPYDISWDEKGDATFAGNRCKTSSPDGLCEGGVHHGKGNDGGGNGDNRGDDHGGGNTADHGDHNRHHDDADESKSGHSSDDEHGDKDARNGDCKDDDHAHSRKSDDDHAAGRSEDHDDD